MKNLIITGLSILTLTTGFAGVANAGNLPATRVDSLINSNQVSVNVSTPSVTNYQISPVNLVEQAYRSYFTEQGIVGGVTFMTDIRLHRIDAQTLVEAAITKGRLSADKVNDMSYLDAVSFQLTNFANNQ